MSERIDGLMQQVMDVFAHSQNPETDEWELSGDLDQYPSYVALTELATIAREVEAMCEWLAEEVAMGRHDTVDNVLDAARKAVIHTASS